MPFDLGVVLLEHGEWLEREQRGSEAEPLLAEAHEIFGGLKASPWIARASREARAEIPVVLSES